MIGLKRNKNIKRGLPGHPTENIGVYILNPNMNFSQVNERLHYIGWNDIELDYHTFQLAKECLSTNNLNESGTR